MYAFGRKLTGLFSGDRLHARITIFLCGGAGGQKVPGAHGENFERACDSQEVERIGIGQEDGLDAPFSRAAVVVSDAFQDEITQIFRVAVLS